MKKPNIVDLSMFQNRLNHRFSSTGFYYEDKIMERSYNM